MRHRKNSTKLGRTSAHQKALTASLVCNLIRQRRITTTLAKAKLARTMAEKMDTLGRRGVAEEAEKNGVSKRRLAVARLGQREAVAALFSEIVPQMEGRAGGFTRILKLGRRPSDSSEMAILEWVEPMTQENAGESAPVEKQQ